MREKEHFRDNRQMIWEYLGTKTGTMSVKEVADYLRRDVRWVRKHFKNKNNKERPYMIAVTDVASFLG